MSVTFSFFVLVIRWTLLIQNSCVFFCALGVCAILRYEEEVNDLWNGWVRIIMETLIIILAMAAELASVGYKVSVGKDWIVVVAQGSKSLLASKCYL